MAAKTALVVLLAVCVLQGLHAWRHNWDDDKPGMTPEQFLGEVNSMSENISKVVKDINDHYSDAANAKSEVLSLKKAEQDVDVWADAYQTAVENDADRYEERGIDVSSCVDTCTSDIKRIAKFLLPVAEQCVHKGIKVLPDTRRAVDPVPSRLAAVVARAEVEAASSDFGANVDAILQDATRLVELASGVYDSLMEQSRYTDECTRFAVIETMADVDFEASVSSARSCMRKMAHDAAPAS